MKIKDTADLRNICLVGGGSGGKTTLTERLLFETGTTTRMGTVEEGNTVSDYTDEEKEHKHSLQPAIVHFEHEGHDVTIIDTPGLSDFSGQAIACFPAVEIVAAVVDASKGVDPTTRRLMAVAAERRIPRIVIVNKIDHEDVDLESVVEGLRTEFGPECLPINLPVPGREKVINVFEHDGSDEEGDTAEFSSVHGAHKAIVEQVIEVDDELTEQYLETGDDSPGAFDARKLHDAFEKCLEQAHLVPVCFTSARTGAGCKDLLHIFASLCPSPVEVSRVRFLIRDDAESPERDHETTPDPDKPTLAHVFKVATDKFVGKLGIFRVHQGVVRQKADLYLNDQKKPLRIGHMFRLQGQEHVEIQEAVPGAIAAVSKIDELEFNSVLHDSHDLDSVRLRPLPLPKPMYGLAVELKNHADESKFGSAIQKLASEDPSFNVERIAATKQTVLRGLGELHLRIVLEKLQHLSGIEVLTSPPKIAYKETITKKAEGHHRHKKQTGGAGQFGEVHLRIEPLPADHPEGFEFVNATVGGSIPRQFMPAIEKGVRKVMQDGAVAGYPMTGVKVEVYDGKHHAVDSKEVAFIAAGKWAFIDAVNKAAPVLLEPVVELEVTAPASNMGDITGDLAGKRGQIVDTGVGANDVCVITAHVPLGELQNYSSQLKSMTGGQGNYTMDYSHDEPTPPHVQQEVVNAFEGHKEED